MENTHSFSLSLSLQLWTFRSIFEHFKPPLYFSFFLSFSNLSSTSFSSISSQIMRIISEDYKIFFHTSTLFFFFNKLYFVSLVSRHYREPDNWGDRRSNALRFHNNKGGVPQLWLQRLCGIINQIESMSPLWKADLATYSFIIIRGASVLPNLPPSPTSPTISPSFITPS